MIRGGQIVAEEDEDFSQFLRDKKPPPVTAASRKQQEGAIASRTELMIIIERVYGEEGRVERQVITDPLIIAAYRRERPMYEQRRDARRVTYKDTPITLRRQKQRKGDLSTITCTSCGLVGHTRTSPACPRYHHQGYSREERGGSGKSSSLFLRSGDLPLEQTGLRIGEDGKICITKASLERVDASMRQQMRMVIPLKRIKESSAIAPPPPPPSSPAPPPVPSSKDIREERRAGRAAAASSLASILLDIVDELLKHPLVDPFARPVSKKKYPLYYRLIAKPCDLGTIRKKLLLQQQMSLTKSVKARPRYSRGSQFMADIELIHTNCLTFNGAEHVFTRTTTELLEVAQRMYRGRVEEVRELERVILGDKYSEKEEVEEKEHVQVSASEIEVGGEGDFFDSSMQPVFPSHSSQQRHPPMTELERMVMELGGNGASEIKVVTSPTAPPEHAIDEKSSEGGGGEAASKIRLKLFLRK